MFFAIKRYQWAMLFACLSMLVLGLGDNIRGPLFADLMSYFKLTNTEGSMTFAATSAAAFLGNVLSAPLMRVMTLARLLLISVFLMAVGLFCMGYAPTFFFYMLSAVIFGLSLGLMAVVQNLIVAENLEPAKQPKSLSALHGLYGLSSLLAPLIASRAPEIFGPWRSAFFITSAACAVVLLGSLMVSAAPAFEIHQHASNKDQKKTPKRTLFAVGGIFAFYVAAEILVSTRLALYVRTYFNMDLEHSSNYVTYFFIFMMLGRAFFAVKSFTFSLRQQLNASLLASLICLVAGLWIHPFLITVVGLTMAPFYPISVAYISEITGIQKRKFITFALSFQSFCVISMHLGVGFLTDQYGLFYAFGVGLVSLVLSLICVNFHPAVSIEPT